MARSSTVALFETMADVLKDLGGIAPERVRMRPPPGKATEKDLLRLMRTSDRLYELVDRTLVEKETGYGEGGLAADIVRLLGKYLDQNDLGDLLGADSSMRLWPGLVRLPDVTFVAWEKYPNRERPSEPIPDIVPDLAIEILSKGNTPEEMKGKVREYFQAGVSLVWLVDPVSRSIDVCTSPEQRISLHEEDTIDGGEVLPGLKLTLKAIFAKTPRIYRGRKPSLRPRKRRNGE